MLVVSCSPASCLPSPCPGTKPMFMSSLLPMPFVDASQLGTRAVEVEAGGVGGSIDGDDDDDDDDSDGTRAGATVP